MYHSFHFVSGKVESFAHGAWGFFSIFFKTRYAPKPPKMVFRSMQVNLHNLNTAYLNLSIQMQLLARKIWIHYLIGPVPGKECGIRTRQVQKQPKREDHHVPNRIKSSNPYRSATTGLFCVGRWFITKWQKIVQQYTRHVFSDGFPEPAGESPFPTSSADLLSYKLLQPATTVPPR